LSLVVAVVRGVVVIHTELIFNVKRLESIIIIVIIIIIEIFIFKLLKSARIFPCN